MEPAAPKTLCFDLDGTLCTAQGRDYEAAEPFPWAVERVNELAAAGHEIIIMTARGAATGIDWSEVTRDQLARWGVTYHELRFGKPRADVFIDDRAVHSDSWRADDAFGPPGYDRGGPPRKLPTTVAGHVTTVVEAGRTFAGRPLRLKQHVERARALAEAAGVRGVPAAAELADAVERVLPGLDETGGEDVSFAIRLSDASGVAFLDVWDCAIDARTYVSCRPIRQTAAGLARMLAGPAGGPPAVAASTEPAPDTAWPLHVDGDGAVEDLFGGQLGIVSGSRITLAGAGPLPSVAAGWLAELAGGLGLELDSARPTLDGLRGADEAFVLGFPFCLVPVAEVDGQAVGGGGAGACTRRLLEAWGESAGADLAGEAAAMLERGGAEPSVR